MSRPIDTANYRKRLAEQGKCADCRKFLGPPPQPVRCGDCREVASKADRDRYDVRVGRDRPPPTFDDFEALESGRGRR